MRQSRLTLLRAILYCIITYTHAISNIDSLNDAISNMLGLNVKHEYSKPNRKLQNTAYIGDNRPKIYIYEDLPAEFHNFEKHGDTTDSFYGLDQLFPQLLRQSPYWTNNTNEADFFYVDAWLMHVENHYGVFSRLIPHLQKMGPWWDRKQGADHIFAVSADQGRCEHTSHTPEKAILLQHYGRVGGNPSTQCSLTDLSGRLKWGADCDMEMQLAEAVIFKRVTTPCHIPRQDIIVPPPCYEPHPDKDFTHKFKTPYIHKELQGRNRTKMLFYSGKIDLYGGDPHRKPWEDAAYSFGARQTVYRMFGNRSGYEILTHHTHEDYWERLSDSVFCLAAAGWGWGGRMKTAVTRGCIPVIIQDGIKVEWEEQLPLQLYALRIPTWMAHKLPEILQMMVDKGHVAEMQKAMSCTWRLHWWRRPEGRAFELVLCELKRRLLGKDHIVLNTGACTLDCGDGKLVRLTEGFNNV